ncbi:MAG: hypothetical protein K2F90_03240 [Clostridiales bacterium]|nr:hypothetical protein [Clostridiales bacterium]
MLTEEEYFKFIIKQQKMLTDEIKEAIKEQEKLSKLAHEMQDVRDALEEKSRDLIILGFAKLKEKYPDIENKLSQKETTLEAMRWLLNEFINKSENYLYVSDRMKEIPEFQENQKLQDELGIATYNYFNAVYVLNKKIDSDRKKFFSKVYIEKMDEYADKGLLLYFLETPDIDLFDEELTEDILIDTFLYNDCISFKIMLERYVNIPNPSPIMRRKCEDLVDAINLINDGCYRAAARNIFALLESEHKRCADAFEGYFTKRKKYKKGHERANKIKNLLDKISIEWEQHSWEKINDYYKKVFANNKIEGVCFRNGIVHGDYPEDAIDTNAREVAKLVLLWLNLRLIADSLSILEDGYNSVLSYITGMAIAQES